MFLQNLSLTPQEDEDFVENGSLEANQETAGFYEEPQKRLAIGGAFNRLMMFAYLKKADSITDKAPTGKVSRLSVT